MHYPRLDLSHLNPDQNSKRCGADTSGFTLIELLVVIAIIALLVSILLPSLNKAKELARSAVCLSNTRNMGIGLIYYAQEYNGRFPSAFGTPSWGDPKWYAYRSLGQFIENPDLYNCPSDDDPEDITGGYNWNLSNDEASFVGLSYMLNCGWDRTVSYRIQESIERPATLRAIGDRGEGKFHNGAYNMENFNHWEGMFPFNQHGGKVNYSYFDGHAETQPGAEAPDEEPSYDYEGTSQWSGKPTDFNRAFDPWYKFSDADRP